MADVKLDEYFRFQIERKIINLYKSFLIILEDQRQNRTINTEEYQNLRKKVLDLGNDAVRELKEHLDKVTLTLK